MSEHETTTTAPGDADGTVPTPDPTVPTEVGDGAETVASEDGPGAEAGASEDVDSGTDTGRGTADPAPGDATGRVGAPDDGVAVEEVDGDVASATDTAEAASEGNDADGASSHAGGEGDGAAGEVPADGAAAAPGGRRRQLEREGEVAADFIETLLDICDLDGDLDVDVDGDRAAVSLVDSDEGRVPRRLVGPEGQVLEALQELTRLAVQSETGERSRLMLDVAGFRADRRGQLVTLAGEAIAEVKESGEAKSLAPMSAFERKVVHDEVLAAGLSSESEGSEPRRYVVVLPA